MKYRAILITLLLLATLLAGTAAPAAVERWDESSLDLWASLPVQEQGRIKPFDTFARFSLLRLNGKRTFNLGEERLTATEWLVNCLLYPEVAKTYKNFIIDDSDVIVSLKLPPHDEKRDRYSYNELLPGRHELMRLGSQYQSIDHAKRTPLQSQIVNLANNIFFFESLLRYFDFARTSLTIPENSYLSDLFSTKNVGAVELIANGPQLLEVIRKELQEKGDEGARPTMDAVRPLFDTFNSANAIAMLPPLHEKEKEWKTPSELLSVIFGQAHAHEHHTLLTDFAEIAANAENRTAAIAALQQFHAGAKQHAMLRGEYDKIPLELHYYRAGYLFISQWLYVLSFVLVAIGWILPNRKWLHRIIPVTVIIPTILLTIAITLRCIIRSRPPVTTLYETILFVVLTAVVASLFIEWLNRRRVGVSFAAILGAIGMFIAARYEAKEASDTMPSMVAVLDTNFWLSTHVTTIIIGYGGCLLASALAHLYVLGRLLGFKKGDAEFYTSLGKTIYGVVCFGFLFSCVGTVLGGIWANDSWGRFWGWDPKENGALLICLWTLIIIHAKLGRYISHLGVSITSLILAIVVSFSWWGVNLLGVGLHSYGFTSGIWRMLLIFWAIEVFFILLGTAVWLRDGGDDVNDGVVAE